MRKLRICIGSNDGNTIAKTHMGDTDFFYIYDLIEATGDTFVEQRANIAKDMDHAQSDKVVRRMLLFLLLKCLVIP